MSWMSYDICFCANKTCNLRSNCERNTDRLKDWPHPVSMAAFATDENGKCEYYVPMNEESEVEK